MPGSARALTRATNSERMLCRRVLLDLHNCRASRSSHFVSVVTVWFPSSTLFLRDSFVARPRDHTPRRSSSCAAPRALRTMGLSSCFGKRGVQMAGAVPGKPSADSSSAASTVPDSLIRVGLIAEFQALLQARVAASSQHGDASTSTQPEVGPSQEVPGGIFPFACKTVVVPGSEPAQRISVFFVRDEFHAIADDCAHKQASLALGDIEDVQQACIHVSPIASVCGSPTSGVTHSTPASIAGDTGVLLPQPSTHPGICVRCPKHRKKFPGGLYFSLTDGRAVCKAESEHWSDDFHVAVYPVVVDRARGIVFVNPTPLPPASLRLLPQGDKGPADASRIFAPWTVYAIEKYKTDDFVLVSMSRRGAEEASQRPDRPTRISGSDGEEIRYLAWHVAVRIPLSAAPDSTDVIAGDGSDNGGGASNFIEREYTPISDWEEYRAGRLRFLIRLYPQGAFSNALRSNVRPGATVHVSEPASTIAADQIPSSLENPLDIVIIAGGTGITPALQLLKETERHEVHCLDGWSSLRLVLSVRTSHELLLIPEILPFFAPPDVAAKNNSVLNVFLSREADGSAGPGAATSAVAGVSLSSTGSPAPTSTASLSSLLSLPPAISIATPHEDLTTLVSAVGVQDCVQYGRLGVADLHRLIPIGSSVAAASAAAGSSVVVVVVGPRSLLETASTFCDEHRPGAKLIVLEA